MIEYAFSRVHLAERHRGQQNAIDHNSRLYLIGQLNRAFTHHRRIHSSVMYKNVDLPTNQNHRPILHVL